MGRVGNFRAAGIFFRYQFPCVIFFLGRSMNIFVGLIAVHEFFHLIFPCANIFLYFARPPYISFLMVRPLLPVEGQETCVTFCMFAINFETKTWQYSPYNVNNDRQLY